LVLGILATGDGSADKPYLVSRVSDEYDILRHTKKGMKGQSLRTKGDKSFDVIACQDGQELWFDITAVFGSMKKMLAD
jgi:hypothetical protein